MSPEIVLEEENTNKKEDKQTDLTVYVAPEYVCELNVNTIFSQLNDKALKETQSKFKDFKVFNSAIDGDEKNAKFVGGGEHIILIVPLDREKYKEENIKDQFLNVAKEYLTWFAGPDIAGNIKEDDLVPKYDKMTDEEIDAKEEELSSKEKSEENSEESSEETNPEENKSDDNNQDENNPDENNTEDNKSDSDDKDTTEDDGNENDDVNDKSKEQKDEDKTKNNESTVTSSLMNLLFESTFEDDKMIGYEQNEKIVGYTVAYKLKVGEENKSKFSNAFVNLLKNFGKAFGSLGLEFSSMSGGQSYRTGQLKDGLDRLFGKSIDGNKLPSEVKNILNKKYPDLNNIETEIISTKTKLSSSSFINRMEPKDISAMKGADYALLIKVTRDKNGETDVINKSELAKVVTSAIETDGVGHKAKSNLVKPENIILINNFKENSEQELKTPDSKIDTKTESIELSYDGLELLDEQLDNRTKRHVEMFIEKHGAKKLVASKDDIIRYVKQKYDYLDKNFVKDYKKTDSEGYYNLQPDDKFFDVKEYLIGRPEYTFKVKADKKKKTKEKKVIVPETKGFYTDFFNSSDDDGMIAYFNNYVKDSPNKNDRRVKAIYDSLDSGFVDSGSDGDEKKTKYIKFIDISPENPDDESKWKEIGDKIELTDDNIGDIKYPDPPEHDGYKFKEWSIKEDELKDKLENDPNDEILIKPIYEKAETEKPDESGNEKSIIFKDIDPENPDDETKWKDIGEPIPINKDNIESIKYPEPPEHDGYKFKEWSIKEDELKDKLENDPNDEILIKPIYEKTIIIYVLFKDIDPENPDDESKWKDIGDKLEVTKDNVDSIDYPEPPEHEGYKFDGWDVDKDILIQQMKEDFSSDDDKSSENDDTSKQSETSGEQQSDKSANDNEETDSNNEEQKDSNENDNKKVESLTSYLFNGGKNNRSKDKLFIKENRNKEIHSLLSLLFEENDEVKDTEGTDSEENGSEETSSNDKSETPEVEEAEDGNKQYIVKTTYTKIDETQDRTISFHDIDPENPDDESKWKDIGEPIPIDKDNIGDIKYPDPPEHDGYKFKEWNIPIDKIKDEIENGNDDIDVYPIYEKSTPKVQIVFMDVDPSDINDNTKWEIIDEPITIENKENIEKIQYPEHPEHDNYTFIAWEIDIDKLKKDLLDKLESNELYMGDDESNQERNETDSTNTQQTSDSENKNESIFYDKSFRNSLGNKYSYTYKRTLIEEKNICVKNILNLLFEEEFNTKSNVDNEDLDEYEDFYTGDSYDEEASDDGSVPDNLTLSLDELVTQKSDDGYLQYIIRPIYKEKTQEVTVKFMNTHPEYPDDMEKAKQIGDDLFISLDDLKNAKLDSIVYPKVPEPSKTDPRFKYKANGVWVPKKEELPKFVEKFVKGISNSDIESSGEENESDKVGKELIIKYVYENVEKFKDSGLDYYIIPLKNIVMKDKE